MLKRYLRKRKHIARTRLYIIDTRWEIVNLVIAASTTGYNEELTIKLNNLGGLVRKYERRLKLLRY